MTKLFVTGGTGLLGRTFLESISNENEKKVTASFRSSKSLKKTEHTSIDVNWVKGKLSDVSFLSDHIKEGMIVVHIAGLVSYDPADKDLLTKVNVEYTRNVVNVCLDKKVKKLIFISSIAAIGRSGVNAHLHEDTKWVDSSQNTYYAISKYNAELEVWRGAEEGLNVQVLNPSIILGKGIDKNESSTSLITQMIDHPQYYVEGSINFVDVRDVVVAINKAINLDLENDRYIISAGNVSIKEFMQKLSTLLKTPSPTKKLSLYHLKFMVWTDYAQSLLFKKKRKITSESLKTISSNYTYDNRKAQEKLGIEFKSLEESLEWLAPFYVENYLNP